MLAGNVHVDLVAWWSLVLPKKSSLLYARIDVLLINFCFCSEALVYSPQNCWFLKSFPFTTREDSIMRVELKDGVFQNSIQWSLGARLASESSCISGWRTRFHVIPMCYRWLLPCALVITTFWFTCLQTLWPHAVVLLRLCFYNKHVFFFSSLTSQSDATVHLLTNDLLAIDTFWSNGSALDPATSNITYLALKADRWCW